MFPVEDDGRAFLTPIDHVRLDETERHEQSENTRRNYESQWKLWCEWSAYRGTVDLPVPPEMVRAYLAERAEFGHKPSTLRLAAAAIVYYRVGLAFLRRGWINLDLLWAGSLVAAGVITLAWAILG